jgi:RecA/RadA recombinase
MSLMKKMKKSTKIVGSDVLSESKLFSEKDEVPTSIYAINIALSGDIDGGMRAGILSIAANSRHFKTSFSLLIASAYMKKHKDAVLVFYDSEFGSGNTAFKSFGIDTERVLHIPITNIEEITFDLSSKLDNNNPDGIKRGDKVFILVDSIGNLASTKEAANAVEGHGASDFGLRAKSLKSFYRIITPHLTLKNIPMVVINHVYEEMKLYGKTIMSGGSGGMLASDNVWIIGRSQEKEGTELIGYNFNINIEKSRYIKEKSKIPILVSFDGGISKYTGILDLAVEAGEVVKPKQGWYSLVDKETGELIGSNKREKDTGTDEFLGVVVARESFKKWVRDNFQLGLNQMVSDDEVATKLASLDVDEDI